LNIKEIANNIDERKEDYKIGELQNYRVQIKDLKKASTYNIFSKRSIKNTYAFHSGGRKEFQVNIGYEKNREQFRACFAFSLETSMSLQEPVKVFEPKIRDFNKYLDDNYDDFSDLMMFYHDDEFNRSSNVSIGSIPDNLIYKGMFIFIGKFINKKPDEKLTEKEYKKVMNLLDRMFEIYLYVEKNN